MTKDTEDVYQTRFDVNRGVVIKQMTLKEYEQRCEKHL